jgi:hypothetical protein
MKSLSSNSPSAIGHFKTQLIVAKIVPCDKSTNQWLLYTGGLLRERSYYKTDICVLLTKPKMKLQHTIE